MTDFKVSVSSSMINRSPELNDIFHFLSFRTIAAVQILDLITQCQLNYLFNFHETNKIFSSFERRSISADFYMRPIQTYWHITNLVSLRCQSTMWTKPKWLACNFERRNNSVFCEQQLRTTYVPNRLQFVRSNHFRLLNTNGINWIRTHYHW